MLTYKYDNLFYKFITNNQREVIVDGKNADWHLFQLGKDLSLTKNMYEQKKFRNFLDGTLPKSLSTFKIEQYNNDETDLYIIAIGSFIHYLTESEKPFKVEQENIRTVIENFDQRIREENDLTTKKRLEIKKMEYVANYNRITLRTIHFVNEMMQTKIKVEGNTIYVYSSDDELLQFMTKEVTSKDKKIQVVTQETANQW